MGEGCYIGHGLQLVLARRFWGSEWAGVAFERESEFVVSDLHCFAPESSSVPKLQN